MKGLFSLSCPFCKSSGSSLVRIVCVFFFSARAEDRSSGPPSQFRIPYPVTPPVKTRARIIHVEMSSLWVVDHGNTL